jgi:DNA/RNA endonuclease YhcR with UshA esterase domain
MARLLGARGLNELALRSESCALHEFEAIAEGVEDVDAAKIVERYVGSSRKACAFTGGDYLVDIVDHERRMSALGGMKVLLDANV